MASQSTDKFDQWALIEIMGHRRLAGRVTEESLAGVAMLRVDVPAVDDMPSWTTYLSASSIFSLSPCSEELALSHVKALCASPIMVYEVQRQLLPAPRNDADYDDDDFERGVSR